MWEKNDTIEQNVNENSLIWHLLHEVNDENWNHLNIQWIIHI